MSISLDPSHEVIQPTGGDPAPTDAELANQATLEQRALAALTNNAAFLGTVAGRRTAIANAKTQAQTGTTVTVGNIAAAQTQIRALYTLLVNVATVLDAYNDQLEATTKQDNALIRLAGQALDDITGT